MLFVRGARQSCCDGGNGGDQEDLLPENSNVHSRPVWWRYGGCSIPLRVSVDTHPSQFQLSTPHDSRQT